MKTKNIFLLSIATIATLSFTACKKTAYDDLAIKPSTKVLDPTPTPMVQAWGPNGRWNPGSRISWSHEVVTPKGVKVTVIETGGISQLRGDGVAFIYLNYYAGTTDAETNVTYTEAGAKGGPKVGVSANDFGKSRKCVAGICANSRTLTINGVSGGIHEIYDNGTFRFSDGYLYSLTKVDPTFVCNRKYAPLAEGATESTPRILTAECDTTVVDL